MSTSKLPGDRGPLDARAVAAAELFPGQNPHPVMRIADDGSLGYANASSGPLLESLGLAVGERLPDDLFRRIRQAVAMASPLELRVGPRTFELLVIRLPEHGFLNVYGTDVTAARLVDRFPDLNPNPVLRIAEDGMIRYANPASEELRHALGCGVGARLPDEIGKRLFALLDGQSAVPVEVSDRHRAYVLNPVRIPELGLINVYATDVTAEKAIVKFPDQNPNPVFRLTWDGGLVYANPASQTLLDGLGATVGSPFPEPLVDELLESARSAAGETVEAVSRDRRYALLVVDVPEFGFINVYGTDITHVRQLETLYAENERLLLNILPEPIADRLRHGERLIADRFEDVTLLFADIVGFTELSGGMAADELVTVLNEVFTVFDGLVDEAGLEKVKTIGDAYMVVGGMPERSADHGERVARMALRLATAVETIENARHFGIRFRVGIHCGPVVAGVIGVKKFIYDIWGDTVNVASRMESTGVAGRIQVSPIVEQRLRDRFTFEPRGLIEVKGKGPMDTFFLVGDRTA